MAGFRFYDPFPLIDGELELVAPADRWIDGMMQAAGHPLTRAVSPKDADVSREQLERYVREYPMGRHHPNAEKGLVPAYSFWMRLRPFRGFEPPVEMAGGLSLRIGHTYNLEMFLGHVGYSVYPPARGRRLAERAVRLIMPLARRHDVNPIWVTCKPENVASRKTCARLGGLLVDIVPLPEGHPLWSAPGLLLTPHVGGAVPQSKARAAAAVAEQVARVLAGKPLANVVDGY